MFFPSEQGGKFFCIIEKVKRKHNYAYIKKRFLNGIASTAVATAASADYFPNVVMPMLRRMGYVETAKFGSFEDLIEFSKTCKIDTINGEVDFNPRPYQIEYLKGLYESDKMFVCAKCRQCGVTTMNLVYAKWVLSRFQNKHIHFITSTIHMALESQNRFDAMRQVHSLNGSTIRFLSVSKLGEEIDALTKICNDNNPDYQNMKPLERFLLKYDCIARQFNSDDIFIFDEYAFFNTDYNIDIECAIRSSGAKMIYTSTPNGDKYNWWSQMFDVYTKDFDGMKISWEDVPEWDDEWKNRQFSILGIDRFNREFEV